MKRTRTQSSHPVVEEADFKGFHIRVVCDYNIMNDDYLVHLYLSPPGGPEIRVFDPPRSENSIDDGLDRGFFVAESEINQLLGLPP